MSPSPDLIDAALAELGIRRMLLAIHDASFPSDADEDVGRGSPSTAAAARLYRFARELGFTGIQLGPQGQTSRGNPSPYDSTIFSRHLGTISLASFRPTGQFAGLVPEELLDDAVLASGGGLAQHQRAHDTMHLLIERAHAALIHGARPDLATALESFRRRHAAWLERDALHAALCAVHAGANHRDWPVLDALLWAPPPGHEEAVAARRAHLAVVHHTTIERYAFGQLLAHREHQRVREICASQGLVLYGDLQVGYSDTDAWAYTSAFLDDYVMGAPPSRTNPDGQPWNYPVLDPDQLDGDARALVVARVDKALEEYDSLRIDHPHGLVCPWVYRADTADPAVAVRLGARLFESPDLPDHPALARYAIVRPDQIDRSCPRHADRWVRDLTDEQVLRYATLFEAIGEAAQRHGRLRADLSCEVLSTMPVPLQRVLERYGLGRWRITQKANLDDPADVYRAENANPEDWVMIGNHDTAPIFALIPTWSAEKRAAWVRHLSTPQAARLGLADAQRLASDDGVLATAMLAELFASRAENISVFFADLFGYQERFNAPGTVGDENWSLRLPGEFEDLLDDRLRQHRALDVPLALAMALDARGSTSGLAAQLRAGSGFDHGL